MNTEEYKKADEEVRKIIAEGNYPIVDLTIFNYLDQLQASESLKGKIEYTIEIYKDLIKEIKNLPPELKLKYLLTLKNADVIDNQVLEEEDSFLVSLAQNMNSTTALDIAINHYGKEFTKEDFIYLHDYLLTGTSSSDKQGIREDNLKFVGTWENGEKNIQYFPIISDDIDKALTKFLNYYNSNIDNTEKEYDAVLKPIIYHGLIAALQLFKDGNTRFARTIQHVELWGMLNNIVDKGIEMPIVYPTRQCFPFRNKYRDLIKNIAVQNSEEAWNEWFNFNLLRIQDNIYKNEQNIELAKQRIK
ncbi:MAG: Fic family protein [Bacilli bacterium]|nr:Fic family protein [Bacilli bacterium]